MDFIAGAIGGGVSVAVGYPLDTVKVRLQTETTYRGIWHCVIETYRTERRDREFVTTDSCPRNKAAEPGRVLRKPEVTSQEAKTVEKTIEVPGFYRGVSMAVVSASFISSLSFGVYKNFLYNICRLRYGSADRKPSKADITFAGCATGAVRVVLISPAEVAKVRLQIQKEPHQLTTTSHLFASKPKYQGALHCLRMILKEEGFGGLYKGSVALLCRDCHSSATYFLTYSVLCDWLTPAGKDKPDLWAVLLSGGCAGVLGWGTATPMDVIKARIQADGEGRQPKYTGLIHCARESIREEGVRVLFKGLGLNLLRAFPTNMMVFFIYEAVLGLGQRLMK